MTEIYIDKADLNMYQQKPAPPKWNLQEYIVTYLKEKDNRYLAWFLHYYEKTLNNNVQEYMRKLFMPEHFADMKQAYIAGLLKALKNYDIEQGAFQGTSDTYTLFMKKEQYTRLWEAYEKLEYTERKMLSQRCGFCFECHSVFYMDYDDLDEYGESKKKPIKPMMYTDIATGHEYSSANTAHNKCEKALEKLRKAIEESI